jgi:hypothetical protein
VIHSMNVSIRATRKVEDIYLSTLKGHHHYLWSRWCNFGSFTTKNKLMCERSRKLQQLTCKNTNTSLGITNMSIGGCSLRYSNLVQQALECNHNTRATHHLFMWLTWWKGWHLDCKNCVEIRFGKSCSQCCRKFCRSLLLSILIISNGIWS